MSVEQPTVDWQVEWQVEHAALLGAHSSERLAPLVARRAPNGSSASEADGAPGPPCECTRGCDAAHAPAATPPPPPGMPGGKGAECGAPAGDGRLGCGAGGGTWLGRVMDEGRSE